MSSPRKQCLFTRFEPRTSPKSLMSFVVHLKRQMFIETTHVTYRFFFTWHDDFESHENLGTFGFFKKTLKSSRADFHGFFHLIKKHEQKAYSTIVFFFCFFFKFWAGVIFSVTFFLILFYHCIIHCLFHVMNFFVLFLLLRQLAAMMAL